MEVFIFLYNGWTVSQVFYILIRQQVEEVLPAVMLNQAFTLEDLCGTGFWQGLTRWERILAGHCMVTMVKRGELPMIFATCIKGSPKKYMLQGSQVKMPACFQK